MGWEEGGAAPGFLRRLWGKQLSEGGRISASHVSDGPSGAGGRGTQEVPAQRGAAGRQSSLQGMALAVEPELLGTSSGLSRRSQTLGSVLCRATTGKASA